MQSLLIPFSSEGEVQDPAFGPTGKVEVSQSCTTSAFHVHIIKRVVSKNTVQCCTYAASVKTPKFKQESEEVFGMVKNGSQDLPL
jgi:hypothetical protein